MDKRAIWKGRILFGEIAVPVRLYAAVEEKTIHSRLLHKKDIIPVRQEMIHPQTGEAVPADSIRNGFVTEEGQIVILRARSYVKLSRNCRGCRNHGPASRIGHRPHEPGPFAYRSA